MVKIILFPSKQLSFRECTASVSEYRSPEQGWWAHYMKVGINSGSLLAGRKKQFISF